MSKRIIIICLVVLLIVAVFLVLLMMPATVKLTATFARYDSNGMPVVILNNRSRGDLEYYAESERGWEEEDHGLHLVNSPVPAGKMHEVQLRYFARTPMPNTAELHCTIRPNGRVRRYEHILKRLFNQ